MIKKVSNVFQLSGLPTQELRLRILRELSAGLAGPRSKRIAKKGYRQSWMSNKKRHRNRIKNAVHRHVQAQQQREDEFQKTKDQSRFKAYVGRKRQGKFRKTQPHEIKKEPEEAEMTEQKND